MNFFEKKQSHEIYGQSCVHQHIFTHVCISQKTWKNFKGSLSWNLKKTYLKLKCNNFNTFVNCSQTLFLDLDDSKHNMITCSIRTSCNRENPQTEAMRSYVGNGRPL